MNVNFFLFHEIMNYLCSVFVQPAEIQGSVFLNAVLQGRTEYMSAGVTYSSGIVLQKNQQRLFLY